MTEDLFGFDGAYIPPLDSKLFRYVSDTTSSSDIINSSDIIHPVTKPTINSTTIIKHVVGFVNVTNIQENAQEEASAHSQGNVQEEVSAHNQDNAQETPQRQCKSLWYKLKGIDHKPYFEIGSNTLYLYKAQSPQVHFGLMTNYNEGKTTIVKLPGAFVEKHLEALNHFVATNNFRNTPEDRKAKDALFEIAAKNDIPFAFPASAEEEVKYILLQIKKALPLFYEARLLHVFVDSGLKLGSQKEEDFKGIRYFSDKGWRDNCISLLKEHFNQSYGMFKLVEQLEDCCKNLIIGKLTFPKVVQSQGKKTNTESQETFKLYSKPLSSNKKPSSEKSSSEKIKQTLLILKDIIPSSETSYKFIHYGLSIGSKDEKDLWKIETFRDSGWRAPHINEIKKYLQKPENHCALEKVKYDLNRLNEWCDTYFNAQSYCNTPANDKIHTKENIFAKLDSKLTDSERNSYLNMLLESPGTSSLLDIVIQEWKDALLAQEINIGILKQRIRSKQDYINSHKATKIQDERAKSLDEDYFNLRIVQPAFNASTAHAEQTKSMMLLEPEAKQIAEIELRKFTK